METYIIKIKLIEEKITTVNDRFDCMMMLIKNVCDDVELSRLQTKKLIRMALDII